LWLLLGAISRKHAKPVGDRLWRWYKLIPFRAERDLKINIFAIKKINLKDKKLMNLKHKKILVKNFSIN
jgi:hypothetical protein